MPQYEVATLGGGCFWCLDAVYTRVQGVVSVLSGYAGGGTVNPTYQEVCSGNSSHVEVVQVTFDPAIITFQEILEIFFATHDPTTLNRQGNDAGTQYRSVVFYHSPEQRDIAHKTIEELTAAHVFPDPIVTALEPLPPFYPAENYHQQYFESNPRQPYCAYVVAPKVAKLRDKFAHRLKT